MKIKLTKTLQLLVLLIVIINSQSLIANNIQLDNTNLTNIDNVNKTADIVFDLSWENSWRTINEPYNWDAAWIFIKYKFQDQWHHAKLKTDGHFTPSGNSYYIDVPAEKDGAFISRKNNGQSHFSEQNITLSLDFSTATPSISNIECLQEVKVFGIEMVYIPKGEYYLGTGGSENGHLYLSQDPSQPYQVTSESNITTSSTGTGNLWGDGGTTGTNAVSPSNPGSIPATYPKGYKEFYVMKYQITQKQYVNFLNTLTYTQQDARINGSPDDPSGNYTNNANRHKIKIKKSGINDSVPAVYKTDNPHVACNFLSWSDAAAYADWACLRPFSELEYEKMARGDLMPYANEYTWGNTFVLQASGIDNSGADNESPSNPSNAVFGDHPGVQGPLRVGAFATPFSNRYGSGASYYGVMELSGNLWEKAVTIGNNSGLSFDGQIGNGELSINGNADINSWPGYSGGENTAANGIGLRGGSWDFNQNRIRISDRYYAAFPGTTRGKGYGFRAARSFDCQESVKPSSISGTLAICSGEYTTLTINGGSLGLGAHWAWYKNSCGTDYIGSGQSLVLNPSSSTNYFARAEGACNTTECVNVYVDVSQPPTSPTAITGDNDICIGATTQLTATGGSDGSGANYEWFKGGCGSGPVLKTTQSISVTPTTTTTYYVRRVGNTSCTNETSCASVTVTVTDVTCPSNITDADGNTYDVIQIGCQCWTAENLKTTKYNDNTGISNVTNAATWASTTSGAYAWYDNDQATYGNDYGALYNWYAIETGKLCPTGWHVPTDNEWKQLETFIGMSGTQADLSGWRGTDEGGKLKETGTSFWNSPNTGATNIYGFKARGGGRRDDSGSFIDIKSTGAYWSATENVSNAFQRIFKYDNNNIGRFTQDKNQGQTVRCIKD